MSPSNDQKLIMDLIKKCQNKFTKSKLSGGNCGTFALAVQAILADNGIKTTLGVLFKDATGKAESTKQIIDLETDVYHIVIEYKGKFFDGTGLTNPSALLRLAKTQYKDDNPAFVTDIEMEDRHINSLVRNETNWSISSDKFYAFLRD